MARVSRTNEEEALLRKSAPKPGVMDYIRGAINGIKGVRENTEEAVDGFDALEAPIGKEAIHEATLILQKYKEGKAHLEKRIVDNEMWYKLRHWECMRKARPNMVEPCSGWLFNAIENKHADAMDNFPEPNVLPREEGDKAEAEQLSSILPVILEENDFEDVYDDVWRYKLKFGTGVYGVFWDSTKLNGLGDISVRKIDILELFWQPGIADIQDSRNIFLVKLVDNDVLIQQYPQLKDRLSTPTVAVAKYIYDDSVDTSDRSAVVDWYYRKPNSEGKTVLHYVKYVNDTVLFATENEEQFKDRGIYDHGKYPFVFDVLFPEVDMPCGFGFVDVCKNAQTTIDIYNNAFEKNVQFASFQTVFESILSGGAKDISKLGDLTINKEGNTLVLTITPKAEDKKTARRMLFSSFVLTIDTKTSELKSLRMNAG